MDTAEANRFGEFEFFEVTEGPLELEIELQHLKITGDLNVKYETSCVRDLNMEV